MANFDSTLQTAQANSLITRNAAPSHRPLQQKLNIARFEYVFIGTEVTTDTITLGSLGVQSAKVIPELSRLRDTGGAEDLDVSMKLSAVIDGTATDLSGVVAFDNASIVFTEIAAADLVTLDQDDPITLTISDGAIGAVTAGETLVAEIAYISETIQ
jgi:hypothetical protein